MFFWVKNCEITHQASRLDVNPVEWPENVVVDYSSTKPCHKKMQFGHCAQTVLVCRMSPRGVLGSHFVRQNHVAIGLLNSVMLLAVHGTFASVRIPKSALALADLENLLCAAKLAWRGCSLRASCSWTWSLLCSLGDEGMFGGFGNGYLIISMTHLKKLTNVRLFSLDNVKHVIARKCL